MDADAIERALGAYLESHAEGVYAAYLFGCVARGTARPDSDVDLAVLLDTLAEMPTALQQDLTLLLNRPVDLVVLDGAPPDLIHRVLRDGRVVLDRDRGRRIAFEVRARNHYFDMKPILDPRIGRGAARRIRTQVAKTLLRWAASAVSASPATGAEQAGRRRPRLWPTGRGTRHRVGCPGP